MPSTRNEMVDASDGSGSFAVTVTVPDSGSGPGVLLLQEIFGVGEFVLEKADDLATLGYVVAAPDVFWRTQPGFTADHDEAGLGQAFEAVTRWSQEVDDETKARDLIDALAHLRGVPEVGGRRVGVMGYCLGGRLAYGLAVASDPDACVSYYGSGIADSLDGAGSITCPLLFHFGGSDPYIPKEQVDAIRAAFAGRDDVEFVVQPGAGHAFENHFAPQFSDERATAAAWPRTVDFLADHLQV